MVVVVIQVNRENGRWEDVRHLPCRYFTSHGHMPGHRHWWCLLYCVAACGVWCVVWLSEPPNGGPSLRQSILFTLTWRFSGFSQIPGRAQNSPATLHSFHGFVAYCMASEHKLNCPHAASLRAFWGGLILWCGVAGLLCLLDGPWSTTESHDPLIGRYDLTHAQRPTL